MVLCTRRRALHGATALLAAVAGCSGSSSMSSSPSGPETAENVETDPAAYALRNTRDEPAVWIPHEGEREQDTESGDRLWTRGTTRGVIASPETAGRLTFADVDGVDGARTFVEGTDFDRETLLLGSDRIGECFTLDLCYVTWSATQYHTYYARLYRDVDVACSTDKRTGMAYLIRIPDTLDPEQVRGSGSGTTSGTCYGWRRRLEARREAGSDGGSTGRSGGSADATSGGN